MLPLASQSDSASSSQWAETQRHSGPHRRVVWKGWGCHVSVSTGCLLPTPYFPWAVRGLIITDRESPCRGLENNENALLCWSSTYQRQGYIFFQEPINFSPTRFSKPENSSPIFLAIGAYFLLRVPLSLITWQLCSVNNVRYKTEMLFINYIVRNMYFSYF